MALDPDVAEDEVVGHEFQPEVEERGTDVIVIAACECGWRGGGAPRSEGGYDEAAHEHSDHVEEQDLGPDWDDERPV